MSGHSASKRPPAHGGPQGIQRSYASQLKEHDPLFSSYEHLQGLPRGDAALIMLRKVASLVKPIMQKRAWKVSVLAEFLPPEPNLLGLNINRGYKICVRLRYHNHPDLFLPVEQVVDTMLHELSHNVWGAHDSNFHRLWDELRDEHDHLVSKGYTGEGFLSEGKRLGGGQALPPQHEMRRLARASAEKRKAQDMLARGSGRRLGGTPLHQFGGDVRRIISDQITRRHAIDKGCGSGRNDATQLSDQSAKDSFKTKADEDDANDRAIAQALYELMMEEENRNLYGSSTAAAGGGGGGGLAWHPTHGLYDPLTVRAEGGGTTEQLSEEQQIKWAIDQSLNTDRDSRHATAVDRTQSAPPVPLFSKPVRKPVPSRSASATWQSSQVSVIDLSGSQSSAPQPVPSDSGPVRPPASATSLPADPIIDLSEPFDPSARPQSAEHWTCNVCTCINPLQYLACDACATERPQRIGLGNRSPPPRPVTVPTHGFAQSPSGVAGDRSAANAGLGARLLNDSVHEPPGSLGWLCAGCGAFMEHRWWTCSACGKMKDVS